MRLTCDKILSETFPDFIPFVDGGSGDGEKFVDFILRLRWIDALKPRGDVRDDEIRDCLQDCSISCGRRSDLPWLKWFFDFKKMGMAMTRSNSTSSTLSET
jgi:hypothetical protein